MKAPEKIYLATTEEVQNLDHSFVGIAHSDPQDIIEPIEYIHKDAFIEKACNYLQENLWKVVYEESDFRQRFVTDFRKYMEGELRYGNR